MALGDTVMGLMARAGSALAAEILAALHRVADGARVVVLVGPGNNGGDGLVAAAQLADAGVAVTVALASARTAADPLLATCLSRGVTAIEAGAELGAVVSDAEVVVDALLGTGRSRPLAGEFLRLVEAVRREQERRPSLTVVAADIPSGADADTGAADPATLRCDATVTFGLPKHGDFRFPAADLVGRLVVADIGLPAAAMSGLTAQLLEPAAIALLLPTRESASNKGSFGRVLSVGGCAHYMGAPVLACRAALRTGAGLVTLAAPHTVSQAMAATLLEVTHLPLTESAEGGIAAGAAPMVEEAVGRYDALVAGCGMGQSAGARAFLEALLLDGIAAHAKVVVDADGLNLLAAIPDWWHDLPQQVVLTPHPGEMARLLGSNVADVQRDRVKAASGAAAVWGRVVVLKGAYTVVAAPDGAVRIAPFANPALATAGTGDVLAGITAALLAQGLAPFEAACCGVFLHGLAGEAFRTERGESGLLAAELTEYLPGIMRDLRAGRTTGWGRIVERRELTP